MLQATIQSSGRAPIRNLEDAFRRVAIEIHQESASLTSKPLCGPADGFAPASVTSAIVAGLLFHEFDFSYALHMVYSLGGDTDTAGAISGMLLGAQHGHSHDDSVDFADGLGYKIVCADLVFDIFRVFVDGVFEVYCALRISTPHFFLTLLSYSGFAPAPRSRTRYP